LSMISKNFHHVFSKHRLSLHGLLFSFAAVLSLISGQALRK
jgi:hypothetical protein